MLPSPCTHLELSPGEQGDVVVGGAAAHSRDAAQGHEARREDEDCPHRRYQTQRRALARSVESLIATDGNVTRLLIFSH